MYKNIYYILLISSGTLFANEESSYGWNLPDTSINVGGYLDMTYDTKREESFLFNDIAVLFSANKNRFDLLAEIELSHISLDGKSNSSSDIDLHLERLQLNYTLNDKQSIEIGRFNSDIGYWNQAPIPILQETTSRPHIVGNFFPKLITGILFRQSINEHNTFSITFQDNMDIAHQERFIQVNRHKTFSYFGTYGDFSWRFSAGKYRDSRNKNVIYRGIGSEYEGEKLSFQVELFRQNSDKKHEKPYSGYLQSTWHFKDKQDAVIRFEKYKDNEIEIEEQIYLFGYTYRPTNNTVLKAEYIYHTKLPLNHYLYSFSVLF